MPHRSVPDPAPSLGLESLISGYQEADEQAATLVSKGSARSCFAISWHRPPAGGMPTILQDTWIRFHKARHTYRPVEPVLPWLFAIARHAGLDNYRKARRVEARETQVDVMPEAAAPNTNFQQGGPCTTTRFLPRCLRDNAK